MILDELRHHGMWTPGSVSLARKTFVCRTCNPGILQQENTQIWIKIRGMKWRNRTQNKGGKGSWLSDLQASLDVGANDSWKDSGKGLYLLQVEEHHWWRRLLRLEGIFLSTYTQWLCRDKQKKLGLGPHTHLLTRETQESWKKSEFYSAINANTRGLVVFYRLLTNFEFKIEVVGHPWEGERLLWSAKWVRFVVADPMERGM